MGKVFFYMTVSVDGFVAGPADEVDRLFRWYFSGDTEIPIPGSPTLGSPSRARRSSWTRAVRAGRWSPVAGTSTSHRPGAATRRRHPASC